MNPGKNPNDPARLEAAIHGLLRSLPDRKAPSGLEARVLAEIGRREALPWWHRSYAHWPVAVRGGFFVGSAVCAALLVAVLISLGRSTGARELAGGVSQPFAWFGMARDMVTSFDASIRRLIAAIPPFWLYGVVGSVAIAYAALAAIGAAAYRALAYGRQNT
jgi:hypothetical protein